MNVKRIVALLCGQPVYFLLMNSGTQEGRICWVSSFSESGYGVPVGPVSLVSKRISLSNAAPLSMRNPYCEFNCKSGRREKGDISSFFLSTLRPG
jgi:hypothetical protein